MTEESKIKQSIKKWLDKNGWFSFPIIQNFKYSAGMKGVCDRIAVKDSLVLFIEVKSTTGKLSKDQVEFKENIESKGCHFVEASSVEDIQKYLMGV